MFGAAFPDELRMGRSLLGHAPRLEATHHSYFASRTRRLDEAEMRGELEHLPIRFKNVPDDRLVLGAARCAAPRAWS
jgi:hypothetical protein